jgi:hypothetical protein
MVHSRLLTRTGAVRESAAALEAAALIIFRPPGEPSIAGAHSCSATSISLVARSSPTPMPRQVRVDPDAFDPLSGGEFQEAGDANDPSLAQRRKPAASTWCSRSTMLAVGAAREGLHRGKGDLRDRGHARAVLMRRGAPFTLGGAQHGPCPAPL